MRNTNKLRILPIHYDEFCHWVWKFIDAHDLFEHKRDLVLLCSGGADSLALFYVIAWKLKTYGKILHVVHFNHQTRAKKEHDSEILLIKEAIEFAYSNILVPRDQIIFYELPVCDLNLNQSDFENQARIKRDQMIKNHFLESSHYYLTGHHINDSFEWWLRGRLSQSHPLKPLGIPLKNFSYRRPFHCVTKEHILKFMHSCKFPYAVDSSNSQIKFERNFLRQEILSGIKKRYPKYLRHYVNQRMSEIHLLSTHKLASNSRKMNYIELATDLYFFRLETAPSPLDELEKILLHFSTAKQGMLRKSLIHTYKDNVNSFYMCPKLKGPLSFSGDIHIWQWNDCYFLLVSKDRPPKFLSQLDALLCNCLKDGAFVNANKIDKNIQSLFDAVTMAVKSKKSKSIGKVEKNTRNLKWIPEEFKFFKDLCPIFYRNLIEQGILFPKA